jgi:hypothetical protein
MLFVGRLNSARFALPSPPLLRTPGLRAQPLLKRERHMQAKQSGSPAAAGQCRCLLRGSPHELSLQFTLPTGQSFRWHQAGEGCFLGVLSKRLASAAHERARSLGDPACVYQLPSLMMIIHDALPATGAHLPGCSIWGCAVSHTGKSRGCPPSGGP